MVLRSKRNFNGGGSTWSSSRDKARSGGSGSKGGSGGASRPTGAQIHGGGGGGQGRRLNEIQQNIKRQQQQKEIQKQNKIKENNRKRIEAMKASQAAQDNRSYEEKQAEEKGIDRWGKPIKEVGGVKEIIPKEIDHGFDTIAQNQSYQDSLDKQKKVKDAIKLSENLRAQGVTADQLTDEEKDQLSDLQFMQDEGVYGGVSGYEAEVNKMKKDIAEGTAGYKDSLAGLARLSGGADGPNEELAKISALGVQEYLRRKSKGDYGIQEDIITGKRKIEGLSPDFFKNFAYGGDDPDKRKQIGTAGTGIQYYNKITGEPTTADDPDRELSFYGDAMGYDPSGQFSWSQIQDDPELYLSLIHI